ncbi:MAG: ATP-binding protein [Pseudomonadota bacterium]
MADLSRAELERRLAAEPENAGVLLTLADRQLFKQEGLSGLSEVHSATFSDDQAIYLDILLCHQAALEGTARDCESLGEPQTGSVFLNARAALTQTTTALIRGDVDEAVRLGRSGLRSARRADSRRLLSLTHSANGIALHRAGLLSESLQSFDDARRLIDPVTDGDLLLNLTINHANVLMLAGFAEAASVLYREALDSKEASLPYHQLILRTNLAEAYLRLEQPENAEAALETVWQSFAKSQPLPPLYVHATTVLAQTYAALGQTPEALDLLNPMVADSSANLLPAQAQLVAFERARILANAGDTEAALPDLRAAVNAFDQANNRWLLLEGLDSLAAAATDAGQLELALESQQRARALQAQLQSERSEKSLAYQQAELAADAAEYERQLAIEEARASNSAETLERTRWVTLLILAALLPLLTYLLLSRRYRQKELDAQRRAADELERQIVERTNELEDELSARLLLQEERTNLETQLAESDKLRALGQLTTGVAHDFNNLMTVVTLSAELLGLDDERLTARQRQALMDILNASDSAAGITSHLLAYARQQPQAPESVPLADFLVSSRPLFQQTLGEQIELRQSVETSEAVQVDRAHLTTALINLLANAREAIDGSGQVLIRAYDHSLATNKDRKTVVLTVEDDGKGMSSTEAERATEPFFTTKTDANRSGLGLSMVYGFVKQSGGELQLGQSSLSGARISLLLPAGGKHRQAASEPSHPRSAAARSEPMRGTVLLVEDKDELRAALQRIIGSMGLTVETASSADEALERITQGYEPNLVITDVVMPGALSGKALADELSVLYPNIGVLLMSGYSDITSDRYLILRKPFHITELQELILETLQRHQAA